MNILSAPQPRVLPNGDTALTIEFGREIDETTNRRVLALDRLLAEHPVAGVLETIPTYRSLLVHYDAEIATYHQLSHRLFALAQQQTPAEMSARRWRVPVVYGGEFGIDLDELASTHHLSAADVIARHVTVDYFVAMIGFTPGFSYLSGLDPSLATPRRSEPRLQTPSGSIHIGGAQTAIQCLAGPSGWHLIGRTPVRTFHSHRDPIFLIAPGDAVTFYAIAADEFSELDLAAERGEPIAQLVSA